MDQYRTEEEQVEALRRWWDENGRSTLTAIVVALAAGFGWQSWKGYDQNQQEGASDSYQAMLQTMGSTGLSNEQKQAGILQAEQLKTDYSGSTYAQFAALHLARLAVENDDLAEAQNQLRWVLGKADKGSDTAQVTQLRLARVLAAQGDTAQALAILTQSDEGPYQSSYAVARGDILLTLGRDDEAREAYSAALALAAGGNRGQVNMGTVEQKLQNLNPVPARALQEDAAQDQAAIEAAIAAGEATMESAAADAAAADAAAADAAPATAVAGGED